MNDTFEICHCGQTDTPHFFRHPYKPVALVRRRELSNGTQFLIDVSGFPEEKGECCSVSGCTASKYLHGTKTMRDPDGKCHEYVPNYYKYRKINFMVPEDTPCNVKDCGVNIASHDKVDTHHFKTKIIFKGKFEKDQITVTNPVDEDRKVVWQK
jgi:hypothetical protein